MKLIHGTDEQGAEVWVPLGLVKKIQKSATAFLFYYENSTMVQISRKPEEIHLIKFLETHGWDV